MSYEIRKRYDVYVPSEGQSNDEPSLTKQAFKDECDVNLIVASFDTTGVLPASQQGGAIMPQFGDFSGIPDLASTYSTIYDAKAKFDVLPLSIRERFNYDPKLFFDFVGNPKNLDEMIRLGIAVKREEPKPEPVVTPKSPEEPPAGGS